MNTTRPGRFFGLLAVLMAACATGRVPDDVGQATHDSGARADAGTDLGATDAGLARQDSGLEALDAGAEQDAMAAAPDAWSDCGRCAPFTRCEGGRCVEAPACVTSSTCESGFVCASGRCVSGAEDIDGDGAPARVDCDETDRMVHPGAPDVCNGIDDDCDGRVDPDIATYYPDEDGDGFGAAGFPYSDCDPPAGYVTRAGDCDDTRDDVHPGAAEVCNGRDDDCAGGDVCPAGCRAPRTFGGHTYVYCQNNERWTTARDRCAAAGMQMVRIDSSAENDFVLGIVEDMSSFIGAVDGGSEGRWLWLDGSPVTYSRWAPGEPGIDRSRNCATIYGDRGDRPGYWRDSECGEADWTCESL